MISIQNAQKLIEDYDYLIGEDYKGGTIATLLITPRNEPEFSKAIELYLRTDNSSLIYPASNDNGYTVTAIFDEDRIDSQGILFHGEIFAILAEKGIKIDYSDYGIKI